MSRNPGKSRLLTATFLLTGAGLLFEVALTRLLSLVHYSGFVFAVLAVALLGLGLGAAAAAVTPALRRQERLADWAGLAAVSALVTVLFINLTAHLPWQLPQLLVAALPFFFTGLALSSLFSLWPGLSHRLYWADLMGAGSGTLLALPLLGWLGGTGTALVAALLLGFAALLFRPRAGLAVAAAAAAALMIAGEHTGDWLEPDLSALANPKPLTSELQNGAETVATASSAFARSDLVRRPDGSHYLFVDGAAGSFVPLSDDPALRSDIGYLPFAALEPDSAFLLGPGGGLDAALARLAGVNTIVAAELNQAGLELVHELSPAAFADTELLVDEGRSALRHQDREFDLIFLSHVITQSSDLRGFALSEASTYTLEAFQDYLDHLSTGGAIALKLYDELTLSRAFFTSWTALERAGHEEPGLHLFAALDQSASSPLPLLLVMREPLNRDAAVRLARSAEEAGHALLYVPHLLAGPPLDALAAGTATVADLVTAAADGGVDLRPVTDVRPFFFQFETGLPEVLRPVAVLALILAAVSILLYLVQLLFLRGPGEWRLAPVTFAALGAGFIALELGLIQRSQLLLGHPTLNLSLVLATVLLGGGLGSLLGERVRRPLLWGPFLTIGFALAWHLAWPAFSVLLQGSPLWVRALCTSLSMLPLALVLGMQLPAGLKRLAGQPRRVAAAWAVNGIWSVIGSVGTISLALLLDYQAALYAGVACYLLVLFSSLTGRKAAGTS